MRLVDRQVRRPLADVPADLISGTTKKSKETSHDGRDVENEEADIKKLKAAFDNA